MIIVRDLPDGRRLVDLQALAIAAKLSTRSVRRHATPIACDLATRTNLYDLKTGLADTSKIRSRSA